MLEEQHRPSDRRGVHVDAEATADAREVGAPAAGIPALRLEAVEGSAEKQP